MNINLLDLEFMTQLIEKAHKLRAVLWENRNGTDADKLLHIAIGDLAYGALYMREALEAKQAEGNRQGLDHKGLPAPMEGLGG